MIPNSRPVTRNIAFAAESAPSTQIADRYSDGLMDDLFQDVDRILDGDLSACMTVVSAQPQPIPSGNRTIKLPDNFSPNSAADIYRATLAADAPPQHSGTTGRTAHHQSIYQPVTASSATHPAQRRGRQPNVQTASGTTAHTASSHWQSAPIQPVSNYLYPEDTLTDLNLAEASPQPQQTVFIPQRQQSVSLPFLLIGAAGISAASTVGLFALSQGTPSGGWLFALSKEASAAEIPQNSDADFLVYLQRSLDVISARVDQRNQVLSVIPEAAAAPNLPITVPGTNPTSNQNVLPHLPGTKSTANSAPNIIERVFVPVYQNSPTTQVGNETPLPNVTPTSNSNSTSQQRPSVPVPAPVATAAALPPGAPTATDVPSVPIVPSTSRSETALPAPGITTAVAPTNAAPAALTDVTPVSDQTLVGILNLGSRSAALFDIDGSAQRAYVGDRIGLSGWTLVSVNGQDVVVRRDGEVRSIYIGQKF